MSAQAYFVLGVLAAFFCGATWAGWSRSVWFASFHGALIVCLTAGFGLGFFVRTLWDLVKLLGERG